jgi:hypothetical protein
VPSPIDISTSSSYWACPASNPYNLEVSANPSETFLSIKSYDQASNKISVCINVPNSHGIYDLTFRAKVRETGQAREFRVRLTGLRSLFVKFDTPLDIFETEMKAYTKNNLLLPFIIAD